MSNEQPTQKQELANALYVWRKQVQQDMLEKMRDVSIKLDEAEWWFERFLTAYRNEKDAEEAAREERKK